MINCDNCEMVGICKFLKDNDLGSAFAELQPFFACNDISLSEYKQRINKEIQRLKACLIQDTGTYLLACPLCNSHAIVWCHEFGDCHPEIAYNVVCGHDNDPDDSESFLSQDSNCGLETGLFKTPEEAIKAWNRNPGNRKRYPIKKVNY